MNNYCKTDQRFWLKKVIKRNRELEGRVIEDRHYSVQIQYQGRRTRFPLETGNKAVAADKAANIYLDLIKSGWEKAIIEHKNPRKSISVVGDKDSFQERPTVGYLINIAASLSTTRKSTLNGYAKAIRKIISDTMETPKGTKYDGKKGGAEEWRQKVDSLYLDQLTPNRVMKWRNTFLRGDDDDPLAKRSRINTSNTLIRNARALMAQKHLPFLRERMRLPDPLPFEGITLLKPPSMRYHSKIDATKLLATAHKELASEHPERYKILLLALVCGLRRGEIDSLLWEAFDFDRRLLRVEHTQYHELKSEDSAGEIDLMDDMVTIFRELKNKATGEFVIESMHEPGTSPSGTRYYRCNMEFKKLADWLRKNGGDQRKPLHELRKEAGSLVAAEYGIFEASRFLRHSDIRITSAIYVDKKRRVTPSLSLSSINSALLQ